MPIETSSSKRSPRNDSPPTVKQPPHTILALKKPLTSRPHQLEALQALTTGPLSFAHHDRATAILPSGTGKTLLQWLVAEALHARTVLICLPSLALVQQTIKVWVSQSAARPFQGLVICSDETITNRIEDVDEWHIPPDELDFPVTTSRTHIKTFLKASSHQPRVIFSTYHSLPLLSKLVSPQHPIDLGIFDEAHHTAGNAGKHFATGLHNRSIPIRKRLFLTATPRVLGPRESPMTQSFVKASMDDPQLYGPHSYTLGFNRAIQEGLICPYQVVITVVTPKDLPPSLLRSLHNTGDDNTIRAAANLIALAKTMHRYGLRKALTFHHTIRDAALHEALQQHHELAPLIKDIPVSHISGMMLTKDRRTRLEQFQENNRAILTNARCLQEGVDIPTVDLVGFLSPRRSPIDIIQAIGRALRTAPSKDKGYILLPIYQPKSDNHGLEHALKSTQYDTIWDVLQAIADQDEPLQHYLQNLRHKDPEQRALTLAQFPDQITIDHPVTELHRLIQTRVIANATSEWDTAFGKLQRYLSQHHQFPPYKHTLATWLHNQRTLYNKRILPTRRFQLLTSLGVIWNCQNSRWHANYEQIKHFIDTNHKHPTYHTHPNLNTWLVNQKHQHRKGLLEPERHTLLMNLGPYWTEFLATRVPTWDEQLNATKDFIQHNDTLPTWNSHRKLSHWLNAQRRAFRDNRLEQHQQETLEKLGVFEGYDQERWEKGFTALKNYIATNKTLPTRGQNIRVAMWIKTQRVAKNKGLLSRKRIALLNQINFPWTSSQSWASIFTQLQQFISTHGTFPKPSTHPRLNAWVVSQRIAYRRSQLAPSKITALAKLGINWNPLDSKWHERYAILQAYFHKHGHLKVPNRHPANRLIIEFRTQYKQGLLSSDQIHRLNNLKIEWDPRQAHFNQHLASIATSPHDIKNGALNPLHPCYGWWRLRKKEFLHHKMSPEVASQFTAIGLSFDPQSVWPRKARSMRWEEHLKAISTCSITNGIRIIPPTHPSRAWFQVNRQRYKRGQLSQEQIRSLDALKLPLQSDRLNHNA